MLRVPCMPQVRIGGLTGTDLQGQSVLDTMCWLSRPLPAVLFLGVNNASTVQPVVSNSLQAAELTPWGCTVHAWNGARPVQASQERAVFYRERAAGAVASESHPAQQQGEQCNVQSSGCAVMSQCSVLQECMRCCPIHRLRSAACISFLLMHLVSSAAESAVLRVAV